MSKTSIEDGGRLISIRRGWDATLDWIDDRELARPLGSVAVILLLGLGFLFLATRDGPESPSAASDPAPELEPSAPEPTPYVNGAGGFAFRAPPSWDLREVGPLAEIVSPNGNIVITFERGARGSLEVASERLVGSLLETRSNSELIGQRRELIGDSRSILVSGTAREDTGEAIRFLAITVRGEPRNYAISIVVPAGSNPEQVLPQIEEIVTSFRTLDSEDNFI